MWQKRVGAVAVADAAGSAVAVAAAGAAVPEEAGPGEAVVHQTTAGGWGLVTRGRGWQLWSSETPGPLVQGDALEMGLSGAGMRRTVDWRGRRV